MTTHKRLPYPGLRAFTRNESDLFFGRDGCIDAMVDRLAATRFLAVLGASGSGKSSLVRTGLLDALNLGLHPWAGTQWAVADLHPGGQPIHNLAAALLSASGSSDAMSIDLLAAFLRRGPRSIAEWVSGGNLEPCRNLLILVDQFEELFRYGNYARQEEAEAFVGLLLESAAVEDVNIHVVITMRSEYLGACALMPGLAERINAGLYLTPRMTREECREAIEGPAAVTGFVVDRSLVNRLLNDLASFAPWDAGDAADQAERLARRADQLPLMQHVLNRLWVRASQADGTATVLRLADYDGLGGLSGALDIHGNEVLSALGEDRGRSVQRVFESLVSGSAAADAVRRPCRLSELVDVVGNRDDVVAVVEAFSAPDCNFLRTSEASLTVADAIVDISHESLIRQWKPLRHWLINEARNGAAWRRLLAAEERYTQREGSLLTGLDLCGLASWWQAKSPTPAWARSHGGNFEAVQTFINTSRDAEAAQVHAEQQRQRRERKRLRVGIAVLTAALSVAVGFSVLAQRQQRRLESNRQELTTRNAELQTESQRANRAESQARLQLDEANKAKGDAEAAKHRAEAIAKVATDQQTRLTQVRKAYEAKQYNEIPAILQQGNRSITRASQDLRLQEISLAVSSVSTNQTAEHDHVIEVVTARKKFALEPTAAHLSAFDIAVEHLSDEQVRLHRPREADALYEELLRNAEKILERQPDAAAYRIAWSIFISYGDRFRGNEPAKAKRAFARSLDVSALLPETASDLHRRMVSYERTGDQDAAEGKVESAAVWFNKEADLARTRYELERTPDNLSSLRLAISRLSGAWVKLGRASDADRILEELTVAADRLTSEKPDSDSYRAAWSVFIRHGDSVMKRDRAAARKSFDRSVAMADLLSYNADDLYKRLVSYDRVGDQESTDGHIDAANAWFTKELQIARANYSAKTTAENLESLRIAADRLHKTLVTLERKSAATALRKELTEAAETLLKKEPSAASVVLEAVVTYAVSANHEWKSGDTAQAQRYLVRADAITKKLASDTPDGAYGQYQSFDAIADAYLAQQKPDAARAAYLQSGAALDCYLLNFRTASPARQAAADSNSVSSQFGNLSWTYVRAGSFQKSIEAARRGLALQPDADWIEANMAHGFLLTGKPDEAVERYMRVRKGTLNARSMVDATAEDFAVMKNLGLEHALMDTILKKMAQP